MELREWQELLARLVLCLLEAKERRLGRMEQPELREPEPEPMERAKLRERELGQHLNRSHLNRSRLCYRCWWMLRYRYHRTLLGA